MSRSVGLEAGRQRRGNVGGGVRIAVMAVVAVAMAVWAATQLRGRRRERVVRDSERRVRERAREMHCERGRCAWDDKRREGMSGGKVEVEVGMVYVVWKQLRAVRRVQVWEGLRRRYEKLTEAPTGQPRVARRRQLASMRRELRWMSRIETRERRRGGGSCGEGRGGMEPEGA